MNLFKNLKSVFIIFAIVITISITFSCSTESVKEDPKVENETGVGEQDTSKWKYPEYKGKGGVPQGTEIIYPIVNGKLSQPFFIGEENKKEFDNLYKMKDEHIKTWIFYSEIFPLESYNKLWTEISFADINGVLLQVQLRQIQKYLE